MAKKGELHIRNKHNVSMISIVDGKLSSIKEIRIAQSPRNTNYKLFNPQSGEGFEQSIIGNLLWHPVLGHTEAIFVSAYSRKGGLHSLYCRSYPAERNNTGFTGRRC